MASADIIAKLHIYRNSPIPTFLQLRSQFEYLIVTGGLPSGQKLPSIRSVSDALRVGPATVVRAYRELEMARLAVSAAGVGFFVIGGQAEPNDRIRSLVSELLESAVAEGIALGLVFEIFVAQLADMRLALARPNLVLLCKREGRGNEIAMHIRHGLADLGAEVAVVPLEDLAEDAEGWLPTLRKARCAVCLLWDVKQAQEFVAQHGIAVVPLHSVLRDDVQERLISLPERSRVGIVASSSHFIDGMITATTTLNSSVDIVGATDSQHGPARQSLYEQVDCIIYGTPAHRLIERELPQSVEGIELIYVPDASSLQQLRRILRADQINDGSRDSDHTYMGRAVPVAK